MKERNKGILFGIIFSLFFYFLLYFSSSFLSFSSSSLSLSSCPLIHWNGGSPLSSHLGSCWCGKDNYCLCTPSLAIDSIIEISLTRNDFNNFHLNSNSNSHIITTSTSPSTSSNPITTTTTTTKDIYIVLVQRKDSNDVIYAIPGGFVNIDETVENATIREVKEETNLDIISLSQFRVYSDPKRDKRRHTVSVVFRCIVDNITQIKQGDDAKDVVIVSLKDALNTFKFAFDHRVILEDYVRFYHPNLVSHILSN